jgi:hypothetical protein
MVSVASTVASGSFLGQIGSVAAVPIFTPVTNGLYRFNVAAERLSSGYEAIFAAPGWTNDSGANSAQVALGESGYYGTSFVVYATSGSPIMLGVGANIPITYNFYYSLESL